MTDQNIADAAALLINTGKRLADAEREHTIVPMYDKQLLLINGEIHEYREMNGPQPETFHVSTLAALIDWISADVDGFFKDDAVRCIVHVDTPTDVYVLTPVAGVEKRRACLARCSCKPPTVTTDRFMSAEDMNIMLQAKFVDDENRATVLKILSNLTDTQSLQTGDDGVSQKVTMRQGVEAVGTAVIKNPIFLAPIRTFSEVEQPESPFVLRFAEKCTAALYEADGGAWKAMAQARIADFLRSTLAGFNVVVIG